MAPLQSWLAGSLEPHLKTDCLTTFQSILHAGLRKSLSTSLSGAGTIRVVAKANARGRGIDVIPERVRAARQEAGLSLAQLADGVVTPVAIHLVETGKSRPSAGTLMHIANRTGKHLGYFTDLQPDMISACADESSKRASRRIQEASWALSRALHHPKLTVPERLA